MKRDVRDTVEYRELSEFYTNLVGAGLDHIYYSQDLSLSHDRQSVYFTGLSFQGSIETPPTQHLCRLDRATKTVERLSSPGRKLVASPCEAKAAIVNGDRVEIVELPGLEPLASASIEGRVEALTWSPDGFQLAILVAGRAADYRGADGGHMPFSDDAGPTWLPDVDDGNADDVWRRVWLWNVDEAAPRVLTAPPMNVWEISWRGSDLLEIVASDHHSEDSWYDSTLRTLDVASGNVSLRYQGQDQVALPSGSPDGKRTAFVEAVCSDRGIVCGSLKLFEDGEARPLATNGVEVTDIRWQNETLILFVGLRRFETVIGEIDLTTGKLTELWATEELTCGEWFPFVIPDGPGRAIIAAEAYNKPPRMVVVADGQLEELHDFASPTVGKLPATGKIEPFKWRSADGLEIDGLLVRPEGVSGPVPLLMDVHGGPINCYRNRWMVRLRAGPLLVSKGYALFLPNPRGSSGRGQDFARHVVGDMGGADSVDIECAIDELIERGIADPKRIVTTGVSYGGFMSSMLVTKSNRFAAAIPISPVTDWYSQHFGSHIPVFDERFLNSSAKEPGGNHFKRSPTFFTGNVQTPCLVLAGWRDKNTPATQAIEFQHGVREAGCTSILCMYPENGHGLREYPVYIDSGARLMQWVFQFTR